MYKLCITLLFCLYNIGSWAQQPKTSHSVYFDVNKYDVNEQSKIELIKFIEQIDTAKVESISILGYCDDRGSFQYNLKLSQNRANEIKSILNNAGVKLKIVVEIQGKGKIELTENDEDKNLDYVRKKNRRVDIVSNLKGNKQINIPGVSYSITEKTKRGDRIFLKNIEFPLDRSVLTPQTIKELDKLALQLNKFKNLHIEIQGHICCTGGSKEAIDIDTGKEELSNNRAKAVYKYLEKKNVDPKRMRFKGYGNYYPLGLEPALDKRVEFLITRS